MLISSHTRMRARAHTHTHTHTTIVEIHALLVMGWCNEKKMTDPCLRVSWCFSTPWKQTNVFTPWLGLSKHSTAVLEAMLGNQSSHSFLYPPVHRFMCYCKVLGAPTLSKPAQFKKRKSREMIYVYMDFFFLRWMDQKHWWLYTDLLQALREEHLSALPHLSPNPFQSSNLSSHCFSATSRRYETVQLITAQQSYKITWGNRKV